MAFIVVYAVDSKESLAHAKDLLKLIEATKLME